MPVLPSTTKLYKELSAKISHFPALVATFFTIAAIAMVYGLYSQQQQQISILNSQIHQNQADVLRLSRQVTATNNLNNGVVDAVPGKSKTVSLVNGQVTLRMPSGWVLATASKYAQQCYIGGFFQWYYCLDTTTIVPKDLNNNSSNSTYGGINISVYKNNGKPPLANVPNHSCGSGLPTGYDFSTLTIDGHNACYVNSGRVPLVYGDQFNNESYTVSNTSYVVVVSSNINNNAGSNGTPKFNDNSQYSPTVKLFAESLILKRG